jgi:hypothetical protein
MSATAMSHAAISCFVSSASDPERLLFDLAADISPAIAIAKAKIA